MSPKQEAYALMQGQPDSNIRIIVDLLRTMTPRKSDARLDISARASKRTGIAKGTVRLPEDFDEHFDDLNGEIADAFYGSIS